MEKFLLVLLVISITSCGQSKEEKVSELKSRIERLNEKDKGLSDSIQLRKNWGNQRVDAWYDLVKLANYKGLLNKNGIIDYIKFADSADKISLYYKNQDTADVNRLNFEKTKIGNQLAESQSELDKLLNIK